MLVILPICGIIYFTQSSPLPTDHIFFVLYYTLSFYGKLIRITLQEEAGRLRFVCAANDGKDQHMVWYVSYGLLCLRSSVSNCNCAIWLSETFRIKSQIQLVGSLPFRLIGLKNIFARQLPNMPREYIVRLLMDRYAFGWTCFTLACLGNMHLFPCAFSLFFPGPIIYFCI